MKLLTQLVDQYKAAHGGALPEKIVVDPLALVALGVKRSIAPRWNGVLVECQELKAGDIQERGHGNGLGVVLDTANSTVRSFDIKV